MSKRLLGPAFIAVGDGTSTFGRLAVEDGRIVGVLAADGPSDYPLPPGSTMAPGLIDVHTNGAGAYLFNRDQGNAVAVAGTAYAQTGTTGFVASVMTAPWESMLHAASEIVEAANQLEEDLPNGARCLGVHFEGPFLNPKFRRIHRNEWLLTAGAARAQEMPFSTAPFGAVSFVPRLGLGASIARVASAVTTPDCSP